MEEGGNLRQTLASLFYTFTRLLHRSIVFFVHTYKWVELQLFSLISKELEVRVRENYKSVGILVEGQGVRKDLVVRDDVNKFNKAPPHEFEQWKKDGPVKLRVHNNKWFTRLANHCALGLAEPYMDHWWDCDDLVEFGHRTFRSRLYLDYLHPWNRFLNYIEFNHFNTQNKNRSYEIAKNHYDMGNDLFETFLDPYMNYSCGYWRDAKTLEEAQLNKMKLIGEKLKLKPGMKVLDIGCGWGGLCHYLAENYGVECVGITVAEEQVKYAKEKWKGTKGVEFWLMDYRDLDELGESEKFDRVVSVGMCEHIGWRNFTTFFEVAHRRLKDDGIFLLHTIGGNDIDLPGCEAFTATYVWTDGYVPYIKHITNNLEDLYVLEDWQNFGIDYMKTLIAWNERFTKGWSGNKKLKEKYGERFYRMWTFYLLFSAGTFKARASQLWQIVLSKNGLVGGYQRVV